jgi:hypothetical protein
MTMLEFWPPCMLTVAIHNPGCNFNLKSSFNYTMPFVAVFDGDRFSAKNLQLIVIASLAGIQP